MYHVVATCEGFSIDELVPAKKIEKRLREIRALHKSWRHGKLTVNINKVLY